MIALATQHTQTSAARAKRHGEHRAAGLTPWRIVFNPYHYADGRPTCPSADFYPNERATHKLMAASEFDAAAKFILDVNRQIMATQKVTV